MVARLPENPHERVAYRDATVLEAGCTSAEAIPEVMWLLYVVTRLLKGRS